MGLIVTVSSVMDLLTTNNDTTTDVPGDPDPSHPAATGPLNLTPAPLICLYPGTPKGQHS